MEQYGYRISRWERAYDFEALILDGEFDDWDDEEFEEAVSLWARG